MILHPAVAVWRSSARNSALRFDLLEQPDVLMAINAWSAAFQRVICLSVKGRTSGR
jgi:hypothetical protein